MAPETLSLAGKTAIVTGSGRENGIGAAIAVAFARNGADVALHYVSETSKARAENLAVKIREDFGVKVAVVQGALEKQSTAVRIVEETLQQLGAQKIDILVNNAGFGEKALTLSNATPEKIEFEFGINAFASIYLTQAVVNQGKMSQGGRIINVGSIGSKMGLTAVPIYAAAKAAQDSLTQAWAGELGKSHGITVNTLAPGPIETELSSVMLKNEDGSESAFAQGLKAQTRAAARVGQPADMADAALLLASEKSRWVTAQFITVSGGLL